MVTKDVLIENIHKLHTTTRGVERIKKNLGLNSEDVVLFCKAKTLDPASEIYKKGKNWYVVNGGIILTINSHSYTIITAHKLISK